MEKPSISEVFIVPSGSVVPLKHITLIGTVSPYFGPAEAWGFTIHLQWGSPQIGSADYDVTYPTKFEAMAVREALWAAVMHERFKVAAQQARLEW